MAAIKKFDHALSKDEITQWLRDLRGKPFVTASGFDVTAVFKVDIGTGENIYVAGVNVENPDHRLSTHGEEACIAAMTAAYGKRARIAEGWVMGAPANLKQGDTHPLANNCVSCCGKCRQQIASLALNDDVEFHGISLNGDVKDTTVGKMLPDAFTFRQFMDAKDLQPTATPAPAIEEANKRVMRTGQLSREEIATWLRDLESVDHFSETSQAMIVKLANGAYVSGVKVEEAAFVSMDAAQSAMANANTLFGKQQVVEAWSFGKSRDPQKMSPEAYMPLSMTTTQVLSQFTKDNGVAIRMMNGKGQIAAIKMRDTSRHPLTFDTPVIHMNQGNAQSA